MQNELILRKLLDNNESSINNDKVKIIAKIGNDSLFFFGIFLTIIAILHFIPFFTGIYENFNIGINEVAVSFLGFVNIFFFKVFNKLFKGIS